MSTSQKDPDADGSGGFNNFLYIISFKGLLHYQKGCQDAGWSERTWNYFQKIFDFVSLHTITDGGQATEEPLNPECNK